MQVIIICRDGCPWAIADKVDGLVRAPILKAPTSALGYALSIIVVVGATQVLPCSQVVIKIAYGDI